MKMQIWEMNNMTHNTVHTFYRFCAFFELRKPQNPRKLPFPSNCVKRTKLRELPRPLKLREPFANMVLALGDNPLT